MVAGATGPAEAARLRATSGDALFLVPGYGAQGGGARDSMAGFVQRPNGLEGGVVNASRSVAMPDSAKGVAAVKDWECAIDLAIMAAQTELVEAARA